eukprot:TRINITY_DN19545_c0_g4_i1.p1 TRINITY_DN19545_c0_g4~~TRINITY_DN19545_c0_g4_i1.p1  ORF type:complete len:388 (+),score=38.79 TRINITY_DN19545_c0_g4_i1:38-1201(+)
MATVSDSFKLSVKNTFINIQGHDLDDESFPRQCSAPDASTSYARSADSSGRGNFQGLQADRSNGYRELTRPSDDDFEGSLPHDDLDNDGYVSDQSAGVGIDRHRQYAFDAHVQSMGAWNPFDRGVSVADSYLSSIPFDRGVSVADSYLSSIDGAQDLYIADGAQDLHITDEEPIPIEWQNKTSVMVRNLSFKCTPAIFQGELCKSGFDGLFNYVSVPVNRGSPTSKGYAFIDFVDTRTAYRFKQKFDSSVMNIPGSKKLLEVIPAKLQGSQNNQSNYKMAKHAAKSSSSRSRDSGSSTPAAVPSDISFEPMYLSTLDHHDAAFSNAQAVRRKSALEQAKASLEQASKPRPSLEQSGTARTCPKCHTIGEPYHNFCQMCGLALAMGAI